MSLLAVGRVVSLWCAVASVVSGTLARAVEFEVRGVVSPTPARLADALRDDDDLLRFSAPYVSDDRLADAAAERARLALQRQGYTEPVIEARVEQEGNGRTVVLEVEPGERMTAGDVVIDGLPGPLADRLTKWLTTPQPPASAKPRIVDAGNAQELQWLNDQGRPVKMKPPLWTTGEPAAVDAPFAEDVRRLVVRFLREEGCLVAAERIKNRRSDGFSVAVEPSAAGTAGLSLRFTDEPVVATIRQVEVQGGGKLSAETLMTFLEIAPGQAVSEVDRRRWEEQLRQSGRFIRHRVTLQTDSQSHRDGTVTTLVDLLPYPQVSPLGEPLTREEQVMLRFRSWLQESLDGNGIDLQVTTADGTPLASCSLSAEHGVVLRVGGEGPAAGAIAITDAGLGVFLPNQGGSFEVPLASLGQAVVLASLSVRDTIDPEKGTFRHDLSLGASFGSASSDSDPAAVVSAKIEPVACVALVHRQHGGDGDAGGVQWDGTTLEIVSEGGRARFDERSGRLMELELADFGRVVVSGARAWDEHLAELRATSGGNAYRPATPVSSAIAFFASEDAQTLVGRGLSLIGMQEAGATTGGAWRPLGAAVAAAAADGGFADVDAGVAAFLAAPPRSDDTLTIPSLKEDTPKGDPIMLVLAKLSGKAWGWLDETCGRDAWPTGLARLANAVLRQEGTTIFQEVAVFMGSEKTGPLAHLVASSLIPMKPVAASFAMRGQTRVAAEAFREDCEPVLAILEQTGLDLAAVSIARRLDEQQASELGEACFGSGAGVASLVEQLRRAPSDREALTAVPESLAAWWDASLGATVNVALRERSGGGARMADGEVDGGTPLTR